MQKKDSYKKITDKNTSNQRGFTLMETLIAMLIFSTIVVFGITALVNMTRDYRVTGEIRQSLDTMSYVMEDMSRNIRLGTTFACVTSGVSAPNFISGTPPPFVSCPPKNLVPYNGFQNQLGITFSAFDSTLPAAGHQIMYMINNGQLYKASFLGTDPIITSPVNQSPFYPMTPSNVFIDGSKSGFSVSNNDSPTIAPIISLRLVGTVAYQNTTIPFDMQTSITPRNRQ